MVDPILATREVDWQQASVETLRPTDLITGLETVDEVEMLARILGAQMVAISSAQSVDNADTYLRLYANRGAGKKGATVVEKLRRDIVEPLGSGIAFAESMAVCSIYWRTRGDRFYHHERPTRGRDSWLSHAIMHTSTRLVLRKTGDTRAYAGLTINQSPPYKSDRRPMRTYGSTTKLSAAPGELFPRTTAFRVS